MGKEDLAKLTVCGIAEDEGRGRGYHVRMDGSVRLPTVVLAEADVCT